jgi:hypothetical protein
LKDEIVELDLAWFGWKDATHPADPGSEPPEFVGSAWRERYASLFEAMERVQELRGEVEDLESDIDDLEDESEDIEEKLEQG